MGEGLRRWRLALGGEDDGTDASLGAEDAARDRALSAVYGGDQEEGRGAGLGASAPKVARWLGDVRRQFPSGVVRVLQRDAMDRLGLDRLLLEPELLEAVEPDVHLVSTLLELKEVMPARSKAIAREVVREVTEDLERRLAASMRQSVTGALDRARRTTRPRSPSEVDWPRTISANLKHFQPSLGTVVPERLIGHPRRARSAERDVVLALDQSGSMAGSVVYAGVLGAVLASIRTLRTRVVAFDTAVVDLTEHLADPVDVLFGVQLGGGTDIDQALAYCETLIDRPRQTVLVLVSDLFEGGDEVSMLRRAASLIGAGVTVVALLALSDHGAPAFDHGTAGRLAGLGVPSFACTPDLFGELMAAALQGRDLSLWAADRGL